MLFKIWLRFFLIWPGLPAIGNPEDADVIIVQAFGRNTYNDKELDIVVKIIEKAESELEAIDELIRRKFDPGRPNFELAEQAKEIADTYNLPIITQWEIGVALRMLYPSWLETHQVLCVWPGREKYLETWIVKEKTYKIMQQYGWQIPIELAHTRQISRSYLIVKLITNVNPIVIPSKAKSFDRKSKQWWIRSWYLWLLREIPVKGRFFVLQFLDHLLQKR